MFTHLVRHVENQTTPQRKTISEPTQPIDRFPGTEDWEDRIKSTKDNNRNNSEEVSQVTAQILKLKGHVFTVELKLTDRRPPRQYFHQPQRLSGSNFLVHPSKGRT